MDEVERMRRQWLCCQWAQYQAELEQAIAKGNEADVTVKRDFIAFLEHEAARTGHTIVMTPSGPRFQRGGREE